MAALVMPKMFGFIYILCIISKIGAAVDRNSSVSCPIIAKTDIVPRCSAGIENMCLSDSDCVREDKCCPAAADGGCALTCVKPRVFEGCSVPLDFAIIVDASGSISRRRFRILLNFIEDLMDEFDISEQGTHVAIVEYSTSASVQLRFNDFSGAMLNAANVKRQVREIPPTRGFTYINKALNTANITLFSPEGGMRPDVRKVALVMTDGTQTVRGSGKSAVEILAEASQPLKDKTVHIISLGIGAWASIKGKEGLETIATDNDVYYAKDFKTLSQLVEQLKNSACGDTAAGNKLRHEEISN